MLNVENQQSLKIYLKKLTKLINPQNAKGNITIEPTYIKKKNRYGEYYTN